MAMHDGVTEHRYLDGVRRTGIGAQHVSVNTQESLDQNLGLAALLVTRE
jgi:hypothetical protein